MAYFDHTATHLPDEEILNEVLKIEKEYWYNSGTLYNPGLKVASFIQKNKDDILKLLNLKDKDILFTSGATEANNTAILGYLGEIDSHGKTIMLGATEHASVYNAYLEAKKRGFNVEIIPLNKQGIVDIEFLKNHLNKDTVLLSIQWVSNLNGAIQPVKEFLNLKKDFPRLKIHLDAVQGIGKIREDFDLNLCDFVTISSHKLGGPKASGALIYNKNLKPKLLYGGHQQNGLRPGTEDPATSYGLKLALEKSLNKSLENATKVSTLANYFKQNIPNGFRLVESNPAISNIIMLASNIKGETLVHFLSSKGIYVGTGSACNSKSKEIDPAINALSKIFSFNPLNTIRISLNESNTKAEIDELIKALEEANL